MDSPQRQAETLRELIELFDAIHESEQGFGGRVYQFEAGLAELGGRELDKLEAEITGFKQAACTRRWALDAINNIFKMVDLSKLPIPPVPPSEITVAEYCLQHASKIAECLVRVERVIPLDAVEQFLCGELLTAREIERLATQRQQFGTTFVGKPAGCEAYVDHINDHGRYRFMTTFVEDRDDWAVTVPEHERRWVGIQQRMTLCSAEFPTATRTKSGALYKIIGQRMEKLAHFIQDDGHADKADMPEGTDFVMDESGSGTHFKIPGGDLEVACKPGLIPPHLKESNRGTPGSASPSRPSSPSGEGQQRRDRLRLVRLYWRYLLGSAVQQQLRQEGDSEQPSYLNLRADGHIDLVGFICILAHDQLRGLFPKGVAPTADHIRVSAHAK